MSLQFLLHFVFILLCCHLIGLFFANADGLATDLEMLAVKFRLVCSRHLKPLRGQMLAHGLLAQL